MVRAIAEELKFLCQVNFALYMQIFAEKMIRSNELIGRNKDVTWL